MSDTLDFNPYAHWSEEEITRHLASATKHRNQLLGMLDDIVKHEDALTRELLSRGMKDEAP